MRERIQADIEKKVQGQDITEAAEPAAEPARIIDLMAALKASLGKGKDGSPGAPRQPPPRRVRASRRPPAAAPRNRPPPAAEPKRARKR